jgi:hypothetical protein
MQVISLPGRLTEKLNVFLKPKFASHEELMNAVWELEVLLTKENIPNLVEFLLSYSCGLELVLSGRFGSD